MIRNIKPHSGNETWVCGAELREMFVHLKSDC